MAIIVTGGAGFVRSSPYTLACLQIDARRTSVPGGI
jgi:hypothetical protein